MSVYGELDPMVHRAQFAFKGKREHIAKDNMPNIAYPNQHIDIEITHSSRDHVLVLHTIKITFKCSCLVQKVLTRLTTQIFMTGTRIFT